MKALIATALVLTIIGLTVSSAWPAAYAIDFSFCAGDPQHHCMVYNPQLNKMPESGKPNWHVEIHLPATGSPVIDTILSDDNYTALKNDVAVMAVENIYTTTSAPTSNFCPVSLTTLTNQGTPSYLNMFYDKSKGLDLTGFIYPAWCHRETGPNPINGDGSIVVPEFPWASLVLVSAICMIICVTSIQRMQK